MKERLIVQQLRDFIENDKHYSIALVAGIRKTGKTTALKQLQAYYPDAVYIDLSLAENDMEAVENLFLDNPTSLLLLDEMSHLEGYEMFSQLLYNSEETGMYRKYKVIITGSSSAHMIKLSGSKLGGRSKLFRLPLLTFVEYLYFTDRIPSYADYDSVTAEDFADYLQLKGLDSSPAAALSIVFDRHYFKDFYDEVDISNRRSHLSHSMTELKPDDLTNLTMILAYKLSEASGYTETVKPQIGGQEHIHLYNQQIKVKMSKLDLSTTILADSLRAVPGISVMDVGRVLHFLLWSGIADVEFSQTHQGQYMLDSGGVLEALKRCKTEQDLKELFYDVSICLVSPLYYTCIGEDILKHMGVSTENLYKGMLFGKMLELYVRGAIAMHQVTSILKTIKLTLDDVGEVDVWDREHSLLCEVSSYDKRDEDVHVHEHFPDHKFIRVCSSKTKDFFSHKYQFHYVPYAKLCCMIDTGDIFTLRRTQINPVVSDSTTPSNMSKF